MTTKKTLALVGATGLVGNELTVLLDQKGSCFETVRLFASDASQGEVYKIGDAEVAVERLDITALEGIAVAICAVPAAVAESFIPAALAQNVTVIDCSPYRSSSHAGAARNGLLLCPEVNAHHLTREARYVAMPSPATVQLARVLKVLQSASSIESVSVTSLHATSGAGKGALDELWNQTLAIFNQKSVEEEEFEHQIAFNCIPQVDVLTESGPSREEERIVDETRFLLEQPSLPIAATAIRVPVLYGYAQAVHLLLKEPVLPERCVELLSSQPDIQVYPHVNDYPMPLTVVGTDEIHVGRIRVDPADSRRLSLWIVSDNVRRGVALNALRSAELLAESFSH